MASMSSVTPPFSMLVSSSFTSSSKVKPYWNPEQPPPCTNTRSLSWSLPSSSISSLTLAAALSVKTRGAGMSVTAFMDTSSRCSSFYRVRASGGFFPLPRGRRVASRRRAFRLCLPAPDGSGTPSERQTLPGHPRGRPDDHDRGTVLHPAARRPRGGRHQDRDAAGGHDAHPPADSGRL